MAVSLPGWCPGGPYRAGAATSAVAMTGPGDAGAGPTLRNLAAAITGQGRRAEAVTVAPSAEAILAGRLPAGHPHVEAARGAPDHRRSRS
jgi:hypothetical protein